MTINSIQKPASFPFRHVVIDNYLNSNTHDAIRQDFNKLLAHGITQLPDQNRLAKMPGYDCYNWVFPRDVTAPMDHFYSAEFMAFCRETLNIPFTAEVNAQINHHPAGCRSGIWHTDFIHCYHTQDPTNHSGIRPWYFGCNYQSGMPVAGGSDARILKRVRALTFLYYIDGDDWTQGDGGETALGYESPFDNEVALFSAVAPLPNRLLMFECSPHSFHRMLGNNRLPRSLIIGWLHCTPEYAVQKHGMVPDDWNSEAALGLVTYNEPEQ